MTVLPPKFKPHLSALALAASIALSLTSAVLGQDGLPDPGFDVTPGNTPKQVGPRPANHPGLEDLNL